MPNLIKYSVAAQTQSLKKGNFWIGTGDVPKGPTSSSDYWNGISPPANGYTIYLNKASQGPSIYTPLSDSDLIISTNMIAQTSFTSTTECFNWFNTQSDKMVFNIDYPSIITDGLFLNMDAGFRPSYSTSGLTWYNIGTSGNNGTLTNGPTYSTDGGGSIFFDGTDDYVNITNSVSFNFGTSDFSIDCWVKITGNSTLNGNSVRDAAIFHIGSSGGFTTYFLLVILGDATTTGTGIQIYQNTPSTSDIKTTVTISQNVWHHIVVVKSNNTIIKYFNGSQISQNPNNTSWGNNTNAAKIGQLWLSTNYVDNLLGRVSNLKLYSKGLSASEVLQNYNSQKSRYGL